MNNNSYVIISAEKFADLVDTGCPPLSRIVQANKCIEYDGACRECWKSWLTESEDKYE